MRTLGDTSKRPHVTHLLLSTTTSQTSQTSRKIASSSEQRTKESFLVFTERASDERVSSSLIVVFYGKILETIYLGFSCVEFRVSYFGFFTSAFFESLVKRLVFCASFCCLSWERDISKEKKKKIHERTH